MRAETPIAFNIVTISFREYYIVTGRPRWGPTMTRPACRPTAYMPDRSATRKRESCSLWAGVFHHQHHPPGTSSVGRTQFCILHLGRSRNKSPDRVVGFGRAYRQPAVVALASTCESRLAMRPAARKASFFEGKRSKKDFIRWDLWHFGAEPKRTKLFWFS